MSVEQGGSFLTEFELEGQQLPVLFRGNVNEYPGVTADLYSFAGVETLT